MEPIIARWSDWTGTGIEHLVLTASSDAITADSVVVSGGDGRFAARYRVVCDLGWRVRLGEVELIGVERRLRLSSDGQGHWLDAQANPLDEERWDWMLTIPADASAVMPASADDIASR